VLQWRDVSSNMTRDGIVVLVLVPELQRFYRGYYYDPKDPEGRAGPKTQIRCPDWGAERREIQVLKRQHNIYFRPMMYRGSLPGSCTSQGAMSRRTPRFRFLRSSRGSVGPRVWLEEDRSGFREIRCRRRSSSGVGARFLPGRASPGGASTRWYGWVNDDE
jgi:hypothetical protein